MKTKRFDPQKRFSRYGPSKAEYLPLNHRKVLCCIPYNIRIFFHFTRFWLEATKKKRNSCLLYFKSTVYAQLHLTRTVFLAEATGKKRFYFLLYFIS